MRERFKSKWSQSVDGCHEWTAFRDRDGYGKFSVGGRKGGMKRAHVVAWYLAHGAWPAENEVVRHTCDNPPCVNPAHLLIGNKFDNERDKIERGRHHNQRKNACRNGHDYATHGAVNARGRYCLTCKRQQGREYLDRLTARTTHREVTDAELDRLAVMVTAT